MRYSTVSIFLALAAMSVMPTSAAACVVPFTVESTFAAMPDPIPRTAQVLRGRLETRGPRVEALRDRYAALATADRRINEGEFLGLLWALSEPSQPIAVFGRSERRCMDFGSIERHRNEFDNRDVIFIGVRAGATTVRPDRFIAAQLDYTHGRWTWPPAGTMSVNGPRPFANSPPTR